MKLKSAIKPIRAQRGLTQAELARLAGLSRQALNGIENGGAIPSTAIALQLARALGVRVEELFSLGELDGELRATLAQPLRTAATEASSRAVVGSIGGRWVAHLLDPRQRPRDLTVAADAIVLSAGKHGHARLKPLVDPHRLEENLLLA